MEVKVPLFFYCDEFLSFCEGKKSPNNTYKRIFKFKKDLNSSYSNLYFGKSPRGHQLSTIGSRKYLQYKRIFKNSTIEFGL
jgi:hypothetical protein